MVVSGSISIYAVIDEGGGVCGIAASEFGARLFSTGNEVSAGASSPLPDWVSEGTTRDVVEVLIL